MSKKASNFQKKVMSLGYRGKEIFKPLNTGWIDNRVACVREWIANIFFYTKNGTTVMIDTGYNYDRLKEKMSWLDIDPSSINHILITHQDTLGDIWSNVICPVRQAEFMRICWTSAEQIERITYQYALAV